MDILDVSKYQGAIDWTKVPYDSVIIRVGYRGSQNGRINPDPYGNKNVVGARTAGKKVGVYFFSQAVTVEEAKEEANYACDHAGGKLDLPVYIDSEYANKEHSGRADKLSKDARTACIMAFCTRVMERGYKAGVYASDSWFKSMLDYSKVKAYSIWVARYSTQKPTIAKWDYWQYSSKMICAGINGYVDISRPYESEPIKKDILIGQASTGETGLTNQKAGNQTGAELNIRKYYNHQKGWRALRHPSVTIQNKLAYTMLRAVNNPCIGYDQTNRNTLMEAAQKYAYDPGLVKIDVECDCSSLVRVCCAYAGLVLPDFNTASEAVALKRAGFKDIDFDAKTGAGLQIGDILVTKTRGHTCICVQA